jgi:hypothetical protein
MFQHMICRNNLLALKISCTLYLYIWHKLINKAPNMTQIIRSVKLFFTDLIFGITHILGNYWPSTVMTVDFNETFRLVLKNIRK